jgi:outer membrane protein TolC
VEETIPEAGSAVQKALIARSELKAMDYNRQAAAAAVKIARAAYFPQLFLVGNYYYANPNQRIMPVQAKFKGTWDISLGLSLNIWNWNATAHQVGQAYAQLEKVRAVESQLKDMITLEVQQNYFDLLLNKEKIGVSEQNVTQAEENYRITNERFRAGLTTNSELLDAEVALLQAKVSRTQAFIDYELARARFHKSVGQNQGAPGSKD